MGNHISFLVPLPTSKYKKSGKNQDVLYLNYNRKVNRIFAQNYDCRINQDTRDADNNILNRYVGLLVKQIDLPLFLRLEKIPYDRIFEDMVSLKKALKKESYDWNKEPFKSFLIVLEQKFKKYPKGFVLCS